MPVLHPSLDDLRFDNRFLTRLPADPIEKNYTRQVMDAAYSFVTPEPSPDPKLLAYSAEMLAELELDEALVETPEFTEIFSGNRLLEGMKPYASSYGGHQFGNWAGQLGDGRAINLGDVLTSTGQRWALQLKGAGPTPYSRNGDGYAVLRSSIREFLCSEAMYHLGVPTTRALSLIVSGREVLRDMFYDGNADYEPGAVVCRVAPSFTRFGHFQIYAARHQYKLLQQLMDYTLETDYPELAGALDSAEEDSGSTRKARQESYIAFFHKLCQRTAEMIMHWMTLGFVHGVMNTDNMSILGLTIDYGPYGWLEDFDPSWTPNTTDAYGRRYCFGNQPQIAHWNLAQLAQALTPLIDDVEALKEGLNLYVTEFSRCWEARMAQKLGFAEFREDDRPFITEMLDILQLSETDMTIFHRHLAQIPILEWEIPEHLDWQSLPTALQAAYYQPDTLDPAYFQRLRSWLQQWQTRSQAAPFSAEERVHKMNQVNPLYVMRNYLAQEAIEAATAGDFTGVTQLLDVMRKPYREQPGREHYAQKRPEWARVKPGCSMLSCSS